jgi:hypothetical protein
VARERFISVILHITSQLSNFAPAPEEDPTMKVLLATKSVPFVHICSSLDTLAESSGDSFNRIFSRGRPCWGALKNAYSKGSGSGENENYAWEQVKTLVKAKLQGGSNHFAEKVNSANDKERKNTQAWPFLLPYVL